MTKIVTALLLLVSIVAKAQYIEQVRKAELHFIRKETEEALGIYNKLFDLDRKAMLSQDCLNAAYCEMKLTGFLGAQRFLNLLEVRNVPFEVIEEYAGIKDKVDTISWENFRRVYDQLYASSIPQNQYTVFEEAFLEVVNDSFEAVRNCPHLPTYSPDTNGVVIYLGEEMVRVVKADEMDNFQEIGQVIADSIIASKAFQNAQKSYKEETHKALTLYTTFFETNPWPMEVDIKNNYPFSRGDELLQYVGFWVRLQDPAQYVFMNRGNITKNYLYTEEERAAILRPILEATRKGSIKPIHAFRAINPDMFEKLQGVQFLSLKVEEAYCMLDGRHFLKPFIDDINFKSHQKEFALEDRDLILEKYIWSHLSQEKFSLNSYYQKEESTYSTCEEAKSFLDNEGL